MLTFFHLVASFHYFACFCFFIRKEKLVFLKKKKHFIEIKIWVHSSRCSNSAVVCRQSIPVFLFFLPSFLPAQAQSSAVDLPLFLLHLRYRFLPLSVSVCLSPSLINNRFASGLHFQCTDGEIHFTSCAASLGFGFFASFYPSFFFFFCLLFPRMSICVCSCLPFFFHSFYLSIQWWHVLFIALAIEIAASSAATLASWLCGSLWCGGSSSSSSTFPECVFVGPPLCLTITSTGRGALW